MDIRNSTGAGGAKLAGDDGAGGTEIALESNLGSRATLQTGGSAGDVFVGGSGSDLVFGLDGDDTIDGAAGDDILFGGNGQDLIHGGAGNDIISGGLGASHQFSDTLYGDDGDDTFLAPNGVVDGGAGNDTIHLDILYGANIFFQSNYVQWLDLSTGLGHYASFTSVENFIGSGAGDEFWLGPVGSAITVHGAGGNDYFHPSANGVSPHSFYYGDEGDDFFETRSSFAGSSFYGGVGNDFFWVNENINDHFDGGDGHDILRLQLDTNLLASNVIDLGSGQIVYTITYPGLIPGPATQTFVNIEHFILYQNLTNSIPVFGTERSDVVEAYLNNDPVYGLGGDDTLLGREQIQGGQTTHIFYGGEGDDYLDGGAGDDHLIGDNGDDFLIGGVGADILDGGAGNDTASYYSSNSGVTISLTTASQDTFVSIENLEGSAYNDSLQGDANNNIFVGGAGNDLIDGAGGIDTAWYYSTMTGVAVNLALTGAQTVSAELGSDTLSNIENLLGTSFADTLRGNSTANRLDGSAGADRLFGAGGNDVLVGDTGADTLEGGDGDDQVDGGDGRDTASYAAASAAVTVSLALAGSQNTVNAGNDFLVSVENLIGSAFNDTLSGNSGDNILEGGAGNDSLTGGGGLDIASYANAGAAVTVNFTLGAVQATGGGGTDTFNGIRGVIGTAFADTLVGSGADEFFQGRAGNDYIDGGAGIDTISFEDGVLSRGVVVNLTTTTATTYSGTDVDTVLNFENVIGSIYTDFIRGNALDNYINGNGAGPGVVTGGDELYGGDGNDTIVIAGDFGRAFGEAGNDILYGSDADYSLLDGGTGDDVMHGGLGNTEFWVDSLLDQVIELAGPSYSDEVRVKGVYEYWLPANVENLTMMAGSIIGHGSAVDNVIIGSGDANVLWGYAGNDTLIGGAGDVLVGGLGRDDLRGDFGAGAASYQDSDSSVRVSLLLGRGWGGTAEGDTLRNLNSVRGSAYDDVLGGDASANTLQGGNGDDVLDGGAGNDILDGGDGIDMASFASASAGVTQSLVAGPGGVAAGDTWISIEGLQGSIYADTLVGDAGVNALDGLAGNDNLQAGAGDDTLSGGSGDDQLNGGLGGDTINGGDGFDTVRYDGASAGVTIYVDASYANTGEASGDNLSSIEGFVGSTFNDYMVGGTANNVLQGFSGVDILEGHGGDDLLDGGDGDDALQGGLGGDILDGGAGFDTARYDGATAGVTIYVDAAYANLGEAAGDFHISIEGIVGSTFGDYLVGGTANNVLQGFGGNDILEGHDGNDLLDGGDGADQMNGGLGGDIFDGGAGFDTVRYDGATAGVIAFMTDAWANTGEAAGDAYISIEALYGSNFNDTLAGASNSNELQGFDGVDVLYGYGGNDFLGGGDGNDYLDGGTGTDTLQSGAGNDQFIFRAGESNGDSVLDFSGNGAGVGDNLLFLGYGTAAQGATFVQIDATHWQINSADGLIHDIITIANGATIDPGDYLFG